ncbi:MAG: PD-(D/E)XK nuclease family protein [bacterium]|nr:PD-(D/E)XK nuclease family protein [bacterium]
MLKELIDNFYKEREKNRQQTKFWITDAGRCPRMIFFKFKNAPKKGIDPRILRMFDHGDYIHRLILNALFSVGIVRASEINIPSQELISGRADAIISVGDEMYVLDIKSMNSMVFRGLEKPKEENENQLQLYLHYFKIPKGILLYVNKDTQDLREFFIEKNQEIIDALLKELQDLKNKIDSDETPAALADRSKNWQCQYCQFKDICSLIGEDNLSWDSAKNKIEALETKKEDQ